MYSLICDTLLLKFGEHHKTLLSKQNLEKVEKFNSHTNTE
jgi:hypothetical protein